MHREKLLARYCCDKRSGDAGEVVGTAKAVARWRSKNPSALMTLLLGFAGVIVEYKPKRQRPWSRALVRDGAGVGARERARGARRGRSGEGET